jgi:predicted flap endonuclease-1-like 5' DNA nuclease
MTYPIADLDGIGPNLTVKLKSVGIRTTEKLLDATKSLKGRKCLAEKINADEKDLLRIANLVDRMRIKGIGEDYAELLEAAGVVTVKELKYRNPAKLAKAMAEANAGRKLVRVLPSEHTVGQWIEKAKKLPLKITY